MRIQAKWENGALHPIQPIAIKHKIIVIDVPDDEIDEKTPAHQPDIIISGAGSDLLDRFEQILRPYREQLAKRRPFTEQDYKEMRYEHLEEKHLGRSKTPDS